MRNKFTKTKVIKSALREKISKNGETEVGKYKKTADTENTG